MQREEHQSDEQHDDHAAAAQPQDRALVRVVLEIDIRFADRLGRAGALGGFFDPRQIAIRLRQLLLQRVLLGLKFGQMILTVACELCSGLRIPQILLAIRVCLPRIRLGLG